MYSSWLGLRLFDHSSKYEDGGNSGIIGRDEILSFFSCVCDDFSLPFGSDIRPEFIGVSPDDRLHRK